MLERNSAGKNIEAWCPKCKLSLDHAIIAMEGEVIARVKCKTCGGSHKFRSAAGAQKALKPRAKKAATEGATAQITWETVLAEAKGKESNYAMTSKYRAGDIINHPVFGKGIVVKVHTNKCDMLFRDKERLMATANE